MSQVPAAALDYSSPRRFDPARTPGKKERQRRARNEATFGISDDDMMATDFDFESNLALFDKQVRLGGGSCINFCSGGDRNSSTVVPRDTSLICSLS